MKPNPRILVVDDDRAVRTALQVNLSKRGLEVRLAERVDQALETLAAEPVDLVLTDVRMPERSGLELLATLHEEDPELPVIVMTGFGSVSDAVAAMKAGAADYLIKPVERDELLLVVERALEHRALRAELAQLRREVTTRYGFENLVGATEVMQDLYDDVAAVAETSASVLLTGPTGTGKELLASALHYRSQRAKGPFIKVNCGAIPESLLESELFGHERGAFSGAIRQHKGTFERAHRGTLLLDEIGEIDTATQVKLLRVLQDGELTRVGGSNPLRVDVRVIASTNRDLAVEVRAGRFREDLYYRLNVVQIRVPALAERREDIPLLVDHFVRKFAEREGLASPRIDPECLKPLLRYAWPGNVRQLEHAVERAMILHRTDPLFIEVPDDDPIAPDEHDERALLPPEGTALPDALQAYERRIIIAALQACEGVQARAARRLGVSRSNLNYRIQRLGIEVRSIRYD
ncbi:MAG: sigma-54-dependent Fis family transcriptional regulator [Deltaproteobacteria bacterium]|nr:MAG: sigma-54-dependent Fis family transcriptional regulator [Deltaproteobacteria bacterium]